MLNKPLTGATATCLILLVISGTSWALNLAGPARPLLAVNGATRPDLSAEIISFAYDSSLNQLEVTLNNWDVTTMNYMFSDSGQLIPGDKITVFMGPQSRQVKLYEGKVMVMALHLNTSSSPTLSITVTGSPQHPKSNILQMGFGAELIRFDPILASSGEITCTGVAVGNPDIQVGTSMLVTGAGQRFSKTYHVTQVFHSFDGTKGYVIEFTASTRAESGVLKLKQESVKKRYR